MRARELPLIAAALSALATASPADAACTQAQAAGTWAAYSVGAQSGSVYWIKCTLTIKTNGAFSAGSCIQSNGASSPASGTVKLTNAANCTYSGSITFTADGVTSTVNQATLSQSKELVDGVGTFLGGGFAFNMVRIK